MGADRAFLLFGVAIAVAGAVVAGVALFRDPGRGRRRCPKCWYRLTVLGSLKCPECGFQAVYEGRLHWTRRRWRVALVGLVAVIGGGLVGIAPGSWWPLARRITPTAILLGLDDPGERWGIARELDERASEGRLSEAQWRRFLVEQAHAAARSPSSDRSASFARGMAALRVGTDGLPVYTPDLPVALMVRPSVAQAIAAVRADKEPIAAGLAAIIREAPDESTCAAAFFALCSIGEATPEEIGIALRWAATAQGWPGLDQGLLNLASTPGGLAVAVNPPDLHAALEVLQSSPALSCDDALQVLTACEGAESDAAALGATLVMRHLRGHDCRRDVLAEMSAHLRRSKELATIAAILPVLIEKDPSGEAWCNTASSLLLSAEDAAVRVVAARALGKAAGADLTIEALIVATRDLDPDVRVAVADALKRLGEGRPDVIAALEALSEDPAALVRQSAESALVALRRPASE